jgi:hypothetical protein
MVYIVVMYMWLIIYDKFFYKHYYKNIFILLEFLIKNTQNDKCQK